jgi:hypothetical protein
MTVIAARKRAASAPSSLHARRYGADVPVMNSAEFRQCMEQLAWSYAYLAEALPCAAITVRRWAIGHATVPAEVATWLRPLAAEIAAVHARHPVPRLSLGRYERDDG